MLYDLDLSDYTQWKIFSSPSQEEVRITFDHLPARAIVFDVGANAGGYSIPLAAKFLNAPGRALEVFAFEPNRDTYLTLSNNVRINRLPEHIRIHPFNLAVGHEPAMLTLNVKAGHSGASSIFSAQTTGNQQEVESLPIDSFCKKNNVPNIDFVKIDVECFEAFVLKGAEESIRRFRPVVYMEHNTRCNRHHRMGEDFFFNFFKGRDYDIFVPSGKGLGKVSDFNELKALGKVDILCRPVTRDVPL